MKSLYVVNRDFGFEPARSGTIVSRSPVPSNRPVSPTADKTATAMGAGAVDGLVCVDDLPAPLEAGGGEEVRIDEE